MARAQVYAGICGFTTHIQAASEDRQHVTLELKSDCPDVARLAKKFKGLVLDAYAEIGPCSQADSIYETQTMRLCGKLPHVACPVPAGICKAIEVAAGLALPRDASIRIFADDAPAESDATPPQEG